MRSKYCDCECSFCHHHVREWLFIPHDTVCYKDVYCPSCKEIVSAKCIPLEMNYLW